MKKVELLICLSTLYQGRKVACTQSKPSVPIYRWLDVPKCRSVGNVPVPKGNRAVFIGHKFQHAYYHQRRKEYFDVGDAILCLFDFGVPSSGRYWTNIQVLSESPSHAVCNHKMEVARIFPVVCV